MKLDLLFDEYYLYSYLWCARLVKNWIKKHIKMFCLLFVTLNKKVYNCSLYNEKIKAWLFICQNYFFWKSRFSIIEKFFNIVKKIYNYIHFFTANYYQNKLREFHFLIQPLMFSTTLYLLIKGYFGILKWDVLNLR